MAIINQIGGISTGAKIGALSGPLKALFGSSTGAYQYQYPADLGNDPSRMHIVQFTISNIVPKKFDIQETIASISGADLKDTGTAAVAKTADIAKNTTAYLRPETKKTATTISLYMPDTLAMNYHAEYSEMSIMEATNGLNRVAGAVGSLAEDVMKGGVDMENIKNSIIKSVNEYGPEAALRVADKALGTQVTDLGLKGMGMAVNPQLQLLYRGLGFRTFTLEFLFTPKTQEESDQVSAIVNAFIYASAPTVTGTSGMYFTPPSIFNMDFMMAKTGSFSGLSNMLQKAGNSIIPGIPIGTMVGNKIGVNSKVENDRLYKVGDCVLEDVSVDYAPSGWAAYSGGAPLQTRLNLSFKEIDLLDRTRMASGAAR